MGLQLFLARQARKPSGWFGRFCTGRLLNKANGPLEDMGLGLMDIQSDSIILEIGFGNGRLISKMAAMVSTGKVTGIDISDAMVRQATKKNAEFIDAGRVSLLNASVEDIPAAASCFDMIFTANTIYFWPQPDANISEIIRVLKPGGTFYCALRPKEEMVEHRMIGKNPDIFRNLFSVEEIKHFFKQSGLRDVKVYTAEGELTNVVAMGSK